jgi:F-type H+-transporting ATPase subunit epsilon
LVPGIFTYWDKDDNEIFMAIDSGLLVKYGQNVLVSTRNAVCGQDLDELETLIDETFNVIDEQDRTARRAVSRMEADFIRRLVEIG